MCCFGTQRPLEFPSVDVVPPGLAKSACVCVYVCVESGFVVDKKNARLRLAEDEDAVPVIATLFYRTRDYLNQEFWEDRIQTWSSSLQ